MQAQREKKINLAAGVGCLIEINEDKGCIYVVQ